MCGISGVASTHPVDKNAWILASSKALAHRGPDDSGIWISKDKRVYLSHRRLSIIDLSKNGHQPMVDITGTSVITFNGEIYNYKELRSTLVASNFRFNSNSDTEVILAAYKKWGTDCLKYFDGMFAFAIYDLRKKTIFLARDRAGEKPLYYHYTNNRLYFASEIKALLADQELPKKINPLSFDCYLSMGYVPGELCILDGYSKLPPSHALEFDINSGNKKIWRYWGLPREVNSDRFDHHNLLDKFENLLENSVAKQMIADVPVGVLLSGGVDSSLITAMAVRASNKIKTFTVRFPGHANFDETKHARLIARHFKTEHIELEANTVSAELLPLLAKQFDEPIVDSSMIPTYLVSNLLRNHCSVALGGDGGDELFGGYGHHSRILWLKKYLGIIPLSVRKNIASISSKVMPIGMKGRNWLQGMGADFDNGVPLIANYFDAQTRCKLTSEITNCGFAEDVYISNISKSNDILQRTTRTDFNNYLAEDILVKVDRSSMLNSLEIRAPFLDHHLIEFAYREVPSHLKSTIKNKKILPKMLTAKVLPPEFDQKRKQGFSIPLSEWLKGGEFRDLFYDVLLDKRSLFNHAETKKMLKNQDKGYSNSERLYALVLFELWRKEYNVDF